MHIIDNAKSTRFNSIVPLNLKMMLSQIVQVITADTGICPVLLSLIYRTISTSVPDGITGKLER